MLFLDVVAKLTPASVLSSRLGSLASVYAPDTEASSPRLTGNRVRDELLVTHGDRDRMPHFLSELLETNDS